MVGYGKQETLPIGRPGWRTPSSDVESLHDRAGRGNHCGVVEVWRHRHFIPVRRPPWIEPAGYLLSSPAGRRHGQELRRILSPRLCNTERDYVPSWRPRWMPDVHGGVD